MFRKGEGQGERGEPSEVGSVIHLKLTIPPWLITGFGVEVMYHSQRQKICFWRMSNECIKQKQVERQMGGKVEGNNNKKRYIWDENDFNLPIIIIGVRIGPGAA